MSALHDVLIVEDEPVVREAARRILAPEGLLLDFAEGSAEAVERLHHNRFRAVLCDLMLPDGSGLDLIPIARDIYPASQIMVITGYATLDNALEAFRASAFDFLPKPFDAGEIRGVVGRALAFHDLQAAGTSSGSILDHLDDRGAMVAAYRLGRHAWATLDADGSVTVGAAESFSSVMQTIESIELPTIGDHVLQGGALARLLSGDDVVHRVWSPLSGQVLAINSVLEADATVLLAAPFDRGWLAKIVPDSLQEVQRLEEVRGLGSRSEAHETF